MATVDEIRAEYEAKIREAQEAELSEALEYANAEVERLEALLPGYEERARAAEEAAAVATRACTQAHDTLYDARARLEQAKKRASDLAFQLSGQGEG